MDPLKKDLKQLLQRIIEEEDFDFSTADEAIEKLNALKNCKMATPASPIPSSPESSGSTGSNTPIVPEEFRCPISGELMKDPVLLITGQTYDRFFIQKWFHKGHNTCPRTNEVLSDMTLIPNRLLQSMISQWCLDNRLEFPKLSSYKEEVNIATGSHLDELLNKLMSSSLTDRKEAAKELRETTRLSHEFRTVFTKLPESIERLLHPFSVDKMNLHPNLQEDLITTVLNISIHDDNKKHLAENPLVIPLLIQSLQCGSIEAIANAAAAIYSLSFNEANKIMIGNAGVFKHLIVLLDYGHPVVTRDAASALNNLCTAVENREKAVGSGAVASIFRNISRSLLVDELISILALLSTDPKAIYEMCNLNAVSCLLRIIRETEAQCIKENCASILFAICTTDRSQLKKIQEDENANGTILELSKIGNSRARRKATGILDRLHRAASRTHSA